MCGRYYIDDETAGEIEKLVKDLDRKSGWTVPGDVRPSEEAMVVKERQHRPEAGRMYWGFPGYDGKGLLINARSEEILEKKTFRDCMLHRRCIIPARGFYEWNRQKEKFTFEREDHKPLYLAGCFDFCKDRECFVILTTQANPSVLPVHDRMPLILEQQEIENWLCDAKEAETLLHKTPVLLKRRTDYEQLRLF